MPKYQIEVPGQGTFEVDSPSDLSDAQAYQAVLGQINATPVTKPDTGFTGAFKAGKEQLMADFERLKGKTGFKDIDEAEAAAKEREAKARQVFKPTEESFTEAPLTKFKELLGGSLPYMAAPVAAGIGAAALPLTGAAATAAGLGLTGLASAAQFTGSNLSRKVGTGETLDQASLLEAGAAAIPQAALDVIGLRMIPGIRGILGKAGIEITEDQAAKLAQRSLLEKAGSVALTTGKTMGVEGLTEAGQQVFERLQAGLDITNPEARKEYYDSFIGGAVLGGALGTAGQAFESKKVIPNAPAPAPEAPPPAGQQSFNIEGLQPAAGPQAQPPVQADPQQIDELRTQLEQTQREIDRLRIEYEEATTPKEKQAALVQAQKLDYAQQELEGQLQGAPARPTAPEEQMALDFEQPYPKSRLAEPPPIIGQEATAPAPQANLDLEFAKQRLDAGAPLTPAQQFLLQEDQAQQRTAFNATPTPQLEIPSIVGGAGVPSSYKVTDSAIDTFGVTKKATTFKNAVRGLDLMDPKDAEKFDKLVEQHERKGAKIDMDAVEAFRIEKPEPVEARDVPEKNGIPAVPYNARKAFQQAREAQFAFGQTAAPLSPKDVRAQKKAEYDADTGNGPISRAAERSIPLPSAGVQTTPGAVPPEATGVGSPVGATTRPDGGEGTSGANGDAALAQLAQQVAPAEKQDIPQDQAKAVIPETVDETLAKAGVEEVTDPETLALLEQLGIPPKAETRPELKGGTTPALQEAVTKGDTKGALKDIANKDTKQFSPLDKQVADLLLKNKSLPKTEVVPQGTITKGDAQYNPFTDTVQIHDGQVDSHTMLHETVHGFLHSMIQLSEAREAKGLAGNPMLKNLKDVYNFAKNNPLLKGQYGVTNMSEFASEAMSNPEFQALLKQIPYKRINVFTAFGRAVMKLLGVKVENNVADADALAASLISVEQAIGQGRNIQNDVVTGKQTLPVANVAPRQQWLTKQEHVDSINESVTNGIKAVRDVGTRSDFWERFRIAAVDPSSALGRLLAPLPLFSDGQLRADMLHHQYAQVNNIINNGLASGVPTLNKDGSVTIQDTDNNLAQSAMLAKALDNNPYIKATGKDGMSVVAEVARALRGKEIMQEDSARRMLAVSMMQEAEKKEKQSRQKGTTGREAIKLHEEAKALRAKYKNDVTLNRELQVKDSDIAWANETLKNVPELQQILDIWRNVNQSLIQLKEDSGLISSELAADLRKNTSYVPLFAAEEDLEAMRDPNIAISGTGAKSVAQMQKLKGSELTRNIWENLYKQYAITTAAVFQNQVRKVGVNQLASLGAARVTENPNDPDVNVRYRDANNELADSNGIVNAIVDNPNVLAAFQMMHYELTPLMKGLAASTKVLRAGALINPIYWVKQLIRDPLHASVVGSYVVTPADSISEYIRILKGTSAEANILARYGAFGAVDTTVDLQTFLKNQGKEKSNPSTIDKMLHKVMRMHEASDAATRVAIYKKAFADATSQGMGKGAAESFAVMKAREVANFSVHGNSKTLNSIRQMIPFFSAAVTSLDTVYRAATGFSLNSKEKAEAMRIFRTNAVIMTVVSIAYAMMMQDDEEYQKLPDDVKDGNWLLPNPFGEGKSFIRIPVPFEVGFLFKTVPEAAVRYLAGNSTGKEVIASYKAGLIQNLPGNGLLIPQAAKPILETMTNYSFFTGRSIESMGDQNVRVGLRGQNASETAKVLSNLGLDKINLSPAKIDNIISGYTAQLGAYATSAADVTLNAAQGKSVAAKNIEELPGFRGFMTNPNISKAAGDFYKLQREAVEAVTEYNRLKKSGDREGMMSFLEEERNKKLIMSEPALRKIQTQMATIQNQVKLIKNNEKIDPEVRRERINKLMVTYDQIAKQMSSVLKATKLDR